MGRGGSGTRGLGQVSAGWPGRMPRTATVRGTLGGRQQRSDAGGTLWREQQHGSRRPNKGALWGELCQPAPAPPWHPRTPLPGRAVEEHLELRVRPAPLPQPGDSLRVGEIRTPAVEARVHIVHLLQRCCQHCAARRRRWRAGALAAAAAWWAGLPAAGRHLGQDLLSAGLAQAAGLQHSSQAGEGRLAWPGALDCSAGEQAQAEWLKGPMVEQRSCCCTLARCGQPYCYDSPG